MQRHILSLLLSGGVGLIGLVGITVPKAYAESEPSNLLYQAGEERIELEVRNDVIGVEFTKTRNTQSENPFLTLKNELLKDRPRGERIEVRPVENYATIRTSGERTRGTPSSIREKLKTLNYVDQTIPVLTRAGSEDTILLPNEIIVTLKAGTDLDTFLQANDLSLIRPIEFSDQSYLVRSKVIEGVEIIQLSNELNDSSDVEAAGPNFVYQFAPQTNQNFPSSKKKSKLNDAQQYFAGSARSYQWGLDSRPTRPNQPRTDIYAPEAWKASKDGKGVVVAVLDNLIDWEHPDLQKNVLKDSQKNVIAKDFVDNDADTRMSDSDKSFLTQVFQESFTLSDAEILQQHFNFYCIQNYQFDQVDEIVGCMREALRGSVTGEFHGNMSAGVIASTSKKGALGVAPKAKIIPVRVLGFQGGTDETILKGIRFAAAQNADVINMSLGGHPFALPNPSTAFAINDILAKDSDVIIVASSGNNGTSAISYPAKYDGVVSVGAMNVAGERTPYSNYGETLDVIAPGGDLSQDAEGGILTHTGVYRPEFWEGIEPPEDAWGFGVFDFYGKYKFVQGTSFSAPMISGVFALMKSNDKKRKLSRTDMVEILKQSSSYDALQKVEFPRAVYGAGLVNAEKAVLSVKEAL